jgi:UDP-3-O-[3-hydroxymyristoyl] glucosamine N-acyltransferase
MDKYTLRELATLTQSQLSGNPDHVITGVENLEAARSHEAAFLENPRYAKQVETTEAGVVFVNPSFSLLPGKNYLVTDYPSLAFQKAIDLFIPSPISGFSEIHPTAVIHPKAILEEGVVIGPHAVIDQGARIGAHTRIGPCVCIGAETQVGSHCIIHPNVTIREGCVVGNRVVIQPGAVIGSCGFGYFTDKQGKHTYLAQRGSVVIEDDVEIGANTTIDRARFKETRIGRGSKLDNLVQIGHGVEVGADNLIAAQGGIAGSTKIGRGCVMGGQVGVAGHVEITGGVILAARAAVSKSLLKPGIYSGAPAAPIKEANVQFVQLRMVGKFIERIKQIESKIKAFENSDFVKHLTED